MLQPATMHPSRPALWGARRGVPNRAAALRADAKLALQRVASRAQRETHDTPPDLGDLAGLLDSAALRLRDYCDYLRRALEPTLCKRGAFGARTAAYFKQFEQRQRRELAQLREHVARAPHSTGVAHRVAVMAHTLVIELDAHGRDVASALRSSASVDA